MKKYEVKITKMAYGHMQAQMHFPIDAGGSETADNRLVYGTLLVRE